jgi:hypothetical protein
MFPTYVDMVQGGGAAKASRIINKCQNAGDIAGIRQGMKVMALELVQLTR